MVDFFYLNTNEKTIPLNRGNPQGNTWVGVSALFNLNAVSQLGSHIKSVFLIDHNPLTTRFLSDLVDFISKEPNRSLVLPFINGYIARSLNSLFVGLTSDSALKHAKSQIEQIQQDIQTGKSFLGSDVSYQKIHKLAGSGSITVMDLDLMNTTAIHSLKRYMAINALTIDILYISNIGRRMIRCGSDLARYLDNIAFLVDPSTCILDSWLGFDRKLYQRLYPISELQQQHTLTTQDNMIIQQQRKLSAPQWMAFYQDGSRLQSPISSLGKPHTNEPALRGQSGYVCK
jgi:hypothetical protein